MSFYLGPELAELRQKELLDEAANERLARLAREGEIHPAGHRVQVRRLVAAVTVVMVALAVAAGFDARPLIELAGRSTGHG